MSPRRRPRKGHRTRAWSVGAHAIQIFNQNPRAWRPRVYSDEEIEAYHAAKEASDVDALLIHAVYLLNCASEDKEIRDKSLTALTAALQAGDALRPRPSSCTPAARRPARSGPRSSAPGRCSRRR